MGLRAKGETADEVAGAARALRRAMVRLEVDGPMRLVDTCGTGGGRVGTLNLSTAAAFVVAGAGVPVAKHGNRSYTSRSGSADVLEALGVDIVLPPARAPEVLRAAGVVFLFAPTLPPGDAARRPGAAGARRPTIMNLLGPLANPAGVKRQVIGVSDARPGAAPGRGAGAAGRDARAGAARRGRHGRGQPLGRDRRVGGARWRVARVGASSPARYGLACDDLDGLAGGEPAENAARIEGLLAGETALARCAVRVLLNAAAALYVAGARMDVRGGGGAGDRGWCGKGAALAALRARQAGGDGTVSACEAKGIEHGPFAPLSDRSTREPSVLADDPDHDALDQHVALLEAHRLHGGVGRLQADPAAGLAIELLDGGLAAVDQRDDHLAVLGGLLAVHHDDVAVQDVLVDHRGALRPGARSWARGGGASGRGPRWSPDA